MSEPPTETSPTARTAKGAQRRAELLDVAEAVLVESGQGELTMRAVAAAAQVRLGHLQYYFASRGELVTAVLNRTLERSLERLTPVLSSLDQPVSELVRTLLAEHSNQRLVRIYTEIWALAARDVSIAEAVRGFYATYQDHVAALISARSPEISPETARANARIVTMLIEGAALFRSGIAGHADPVTDDALITAATGLLMPGAVTRGGRRPPERAS